MTVLYYSWLKTLQDGKKNLLWFHYSDYRQHRLTASNFGKVIAACKRNKFPKSLFK